MRQVAGFLSGVLIALSVIGPIDSSAQVIPVFDTRYRPAGVSYSILRDNRFEVIYQNGFEAEARELLWELHDALPGADSLLGATTTFVLPSVLNAYGDRGNGFVTPFPFKTEIELSPSKGHVMSPRHESWLEVVGSHELVHAVHGDYRSGNGITGFIYRFSPDAARGLNLFVPRGFAEGVAVMHESRVTSGAGRLNHSWFTMQYRAGMADGRWSLAQMLEAPVYTRPFDRFYQGGAHFTTFLVEEYGEDVIPRILKAHYRIPIFGFGYDLGQATGDWPWIIGRKMRTWQKEREARARHEIGSVREGTTLSGRRGVIHRRPKWFDESTIITFALGYDLSRGFYAVNTSHGRLDLVAREEISEDAEIALGSDGTSILYSRYVPNALTDLEETTFAYRTSLLTGDTERLAGSSNVVSPVQLEDGRVLAIRFRGQFSDVVELAPDGSIAHAVGYTRSVFKSIEPRPGSDSLAVIMNAAGHQALFLVHREGRRYSGAEPWIGFRDASIYDADWSADGRYLAFTADPGGRMNVYAYDADTDRILQVTNARYGAFEASISPDNSHVAFISYLDERFDLKVMRFDPDSLEPIDRESARYTHHIDWRARVQGPGPTVEGGDPGPYRAFSRISPRMIYPTLYVDEPRRIENDARLGPGVGFALQGADPLQKWTYYGEAFGRKSRLWGEFGVGNASFPVRTSISASRRPEVVQALFQDGSTGRLIRDRSSLGLSMNLPVTIRDNVSRTSFIAAASLNGRSDLLLDDDLDRVTERTNRLSLSPGLFYGWRVNIHARDIIPNAGVGVRWFGEFDLSTDRGFKRYAWILESFGFLPLLTRSNTGIRLNAALLEQNSPSVFNLDFYKPRGWEDAFLNDDRFMRYGIDVVQPILYVDDGFTLIPAFLKSIYLFGFGEHLHRLSMPSDNVSSVGGGIGIQWRLFYSLELETRLSAAFRLRDRTWVTYGNFR